MPGKLILVLTIPLLIASCGPKFEPQVACNFIQNSQQQRVSWKKYVPVEMYIHESVPQAAHADIYNAMAKWEYKIGRPLFRVVGIAGGPNDPQKDNRSVIYWMNTWEEDNKATEQARTTVYWLGDLITEADLRINDKNFDFSFFGEEADQTKVHLESLIVHELGHVLGLVHIDSPESVMATTLSNGIDRSSPSENIDVKSLRCEY